MKFLRETLKKMEQLPEWLHDQVFITARKGDLNDYANFGDEAAYKAVDPGDALLITALDEETKRYRLLLDIDIPVHIEKSTNGNTHLYIDADMTKKQHDAVLKALSDANVIEPGYAEGSSLTKYGATLRLPWVKKGVDKTLREQMKEEKSKGQSW